MAAPLNEADALANFVAEWFTDCRYSAAVLDFSLTELHRPRSRRAKYVLRDHAGNNELVSGSLYAIDRRLRKLWRNAA